MREAVCIVLNERESTKAKLASDLEAALERESITSSRVEIDKHLETIVLQRKAKVVVLDYLLGDYSTGLDIQSRLIELPGDSAPAIFFLTDEPSVSVAVQAMKNGAIDYIEIDKADAIQRLVTQIKGTIAGSAKPETPKKAHLTLEDCIAVSKRSLALHKSLEQAAKLKSKFVVLLGADGSGKLTMARALAVTRSANAPINEVDLRSSLRSATDLPGVHITSSGQLEIAAPSSLIISHAEEDSGEILALLSEHRRIPESVDFGIIVCTNDQKTAGAWQRMVSAEVIELPELNARSEDIPQLTQHFLREVEAVLGKKAKPLDKELLNWLMSQKFSGNIRQLKAVVQHIAFEDSPSKAILEELFQSYSESEPRSENGHVDPLIAASAVFAAGNNLRVAAAKLGVRQTVLREALSAGRNS